MDSTAYKKKDDNETTSTEQESKAGIEQSASVTLSLVRRIFTEAIGAIRQNFLPGLVLQFALVGFVVAYIYSADFRMALGTLADWKARWGYGFSFGIYVLASGCLPEILRIVCLQKFAIRRENIYRILVLSPFWGLTGMLVDTLYRTQAVWFGHGTDWQTILTKIFIDQAIFSPFISNALAVLYVSMVETHFRPEALRVSFAKQSFLMRLVILQSAAWLIWIPGVFVIYHLPPLLQLPIGALIAAFWTLTLTTLLLLKAKH